MQTLDIVQFRSNFPEFNDIARYPDSLILFWSTLAIAQVNCDRWKTLTTLGVQLYTAHEIVLEAQNQKTAANGGAPGTGTGVTSSKSVGSVSVAYDVASTTEQGAGYWNRTTYGQKYWKLLMMMGAGGIQL